MQYLGDFPEDATVYIPFNTFSSNDPQASVTITNLADADIHVHKDGGLTQIATDGATIAIDYDSITGNHLITIDTSAHADYSIGADYLVRIEGTTVDGGTINAFVGSFSIENRHNEVKVVAWNGVDLVTTNPLPNAAADAAGGLPISDAGGLDIDTFLGRILGTLATGTHNAQSGDVFADLPTNFSSMVITASGIVDALVQGYLNTLITETTVGRIAGNIDVFFENSDALTTKTVDDVGVAGSGLTQQNVRDAMKLAPTGGAPTADSVDDHLDTLLARIIGTIAVGTHNPATAAQIAVLSDWIDAGRLDVILDAIKTVTDAQGVAGTGLSAMPWNVAWDAEVQSKVNDALVALHLDHLLAVDYDPAAKPGAATALLNELIEDDLGVSRYTVNALENAPSDTGASASVIADAVWDELTSGHTIAGSAGQAIINILADTGELQTNQGNWLTATGFSTHQAADVWGVATRALTDKAGFTISGTKTTLDALNDITAASVWAVATRILTAGTNLNDLSAAQVKAECDTALTDYDGPTNTEMEARTPTAAQLAYITAHAATAKPVTFSGGSTTTAIFTDTTGVDSADPSSVDDFYNGRVLVFNVGTLDMQVTDITDYVGSTRTCTITAVTTAVTSSHTAIMV
ncbi:hypothetical protein MNBD_GAMMA01-1339 [hydrothermal vent metagenome]|uniref:Uncharacterized protein n=1 Tax=hydrothermal vent metagenome TaxID=652676 RepID=A0A3B0W5N4_9ZZZZ